MFGDGTVVVKHTPGHTPGHQSLYVRLPNTGGVGAQLWIGHDINAYSHADL